MNKNQHTTLIPDETVVNKIYLIRQQKVMLDKDLAALYGVKAIRLREQVKRNEYRFPESFMFRLNKEEVEVLVSQNAIPSNKHLGGHFPYVFTEHGILMLSNVLKSEQAVKMSIRIIEIFVKMREMLSVNNELLNKLNKLETHVAAHDEQIRKIFAYLKQLISEENKPRIPIGFKTKG